MRRTLLVVLAAAGIALLAGPGCAGGSGSGDASGLVNPDVVGKRAPAVTFTRFDGTEGALADYAGKPLLVNWFSTWCVPCVREMPLLEEAHQRLGDRVAFLGLNNQDTLDDGKALAAKTGVTWDLARDPRGEILAAFEGIVMPTTVLVSAEGRILAIHSGQFHSAAEVVRLVDEKAPA